MLEVTSLIHQFDFFDIQALKIKYRETRIGKGMT